MTTSLLLFFLLSASFSAAGFALWRAKDNAGYKKRFKEVQGSKLPQARANDRVRHSRQDLQAIAKAKDMAKNGQVMPAAQLLEQSGLQRECIELLEKSGLIDEAASVLIKMQRQNRAGYVYARNGRWLQASECFKSANLPLDAAKCLRACGRYEEAANLYKSAGKLEDAATCFSLLRRWHDVAKIYLQLKQNDKAKHAYELFFSSESSHREVSFEQQEIGFFQDTISSGDMNTGFVDVLAQSGKVTDLIRAMLGAGKLEEASRIYAKSVMDHGPALISEVSLQGKEGRSLAELFLLVKNFKYAGMVLEQINDFRQAALAFEQSEDFERASYCYERTGDIEKAKALRKRKPVQVPPAPNSSTNVKFPHFADALRQSSEEEEQSPAAAPSPPPGPPKFTKPALPSAQKQGGLPIPKEGAGIFAINPVSEANQTILDHDRALFHKSAPFEDLDFQQRSKIWDLGTIISTKPGDIVVDWSDEPPGLFYILEGEMNCILKSLSGEVPLETIGPGETFGEICLLAEQPASVRFICLHAARLLVIKREGFLDILDNDGTIARKVYKHYTHRLLAKLLNPSKPQDIRRAL